MKELVEALDKLIHNDARIPYDAASKSITLTETDNLDETGLKELTIQGVSECYGCFKLDDHRFKFLGKLIKDGVIHQAVDAILFCKVSQKSKASEKNYIFLI